jgi:flavin reductase (DIM6/NTAB) family NADH-FMN oxidoreductase RutF
MTTTLRTLLATDADAYRQLARRWAATVNVVTVRRGGAPDGFTATAFLTVSMDPPIVLVSATKGSSAGEMMAEVDRFAVNVLGAQQRAVAEGFATAHERRGAVWASVAHRDDADGTPLLEGAAGAFSARVRERVDAGDHVLVLGDVTALHLGAAELPLVYFNRAYAALAARAEGEG